MNQDILDGTRTVLLQAGLPDVLDLSFLHSCALSDKLEVLGGEATFELREVEGVDYEGTLIWDPCRNGRKTTRADRWQGPPKHL